jgi:hypothetical protein
VNAVALIEQIIEERPEFHPPIAKIAVNCPSNSTSPNSSRGHRARLDASSGLIIIFAVGIPAAFIKIDAEVLRVKTALKAHPRDESLKKELNDLIKAREKMLLEVQRKARWRPKIRDSACNGDVVYYLHLRHGHIPHPTSLTFDLQLATLILACEQARRVQTR